jgi:hypothetical protein
MGLPQHTHESITARGVAVDNEALYFVTHLQDGFTKVTKHTHENITLLSRMMLGVCNRFARWVYLNTRIEVITAMRFSRE